MQHKPTNDANMLRPTALPPEAMIFALSCMFRLIDSSTQRQQVSSVAPARASWIGGHGNDP